MKIPLFLSGADEQRLRAILADTIPCPRATLEQKNRIQAILKTAKTATDESELESRVGFEDRISLVSPADSRDYFNLQVVMPRDEDIDADRISVLQPVSMAVLGRRCGENVAWETPAGSREMRIIAIDKAAQSVPA